MGSDGKNTDTIIYGLDARMDPKKSAAYGVQYMILFTANSAVMPVIIAKGLGLESVAISEMLLRTFFLCGVLSILQTRFGHRYPIIDGPSGLWLSVWLCLASVTTAMNGDMAALRAHIELSMVVSGLFIIVLGLSGKMKYIARLFTPLVNGVFLVLMPIQLSKSFVQGMLGTVYGGSEADPKSFAAFAVTVTVMIIINIFATPFIKSIAILIAISIGWAFASAIGVAGNIEMAGLKSFIILPEVFSWGAPAYDPGILITFVLGAFLLFANFFGSVMGMSDLLDVKMSDRQLNRGTLFFGVTTIATGVFTTIGFVPFATSIGIVRMTGVAARKPFYWGCAAMIALSLIGPVGMFFAAIPPPVGYGSLLVLFGIIFKQGTDSIKKAEVTERSGFALGVSMLIGTGLMMQPFAVFEHLPAILLPFASNGLLVGVILAIVFEQALMERPKKKKGNTDV